MVRLGSGFVATKQTEIQIRVNPHFSCSDQSFSKSYYLIFELVNFRVLKIKLKGVGNECNPKAQGAKRLMIRA